MTENINPIELLKEEMDHDDLAIRVNAIHRLKTIIVLTGGETFKNQLLPYLEGLIKKEDDEVLFAIAEELGNVSSMLHGGYTIILPALETLASVEETVVRDAAVKSLQTVSGLMNDSEVQNNFIPLVLRLAGGDWFTSRVSSVNLMYGIYQRAGPLKERIRQKFMELCNEETPMIRRAIASKIGHLSMYVEKEIVVSEFIPVFKQLSSDEQDSVRVLCLDSLNLIAKILNKDENRTHSLPIIIAATEDKSWKIRLALAKNFSQLAEALGKEITDTSLIQIFTTLLKDGENDVRNGAVISFSTFVNTISTEKLQVLVPQIQTLARDKYALVRAAICDVISNIAKMLPKEMIMQKIFPLLLELVEDSVTDVKIAAMKSFVKMGEVFGTEILSPLMSHCKGLVEDKKWRIRLATFETLHKLTILYKNLDTYTKIIEPILIAAFKDRAQVIREFAVGTVPSLVSTFSTDWVVGSLIPKLIDGLNKDNTYLIKITSLNALKSAALSLSPDAVNDKILPSILKATKDGVPNVRFVALRILKALTVLNHSSMNSQIKQTLNELANDPDKDVQYFAFEALQG